MPRPLFHQVPLPPLAMRTSVDHKYIRCFRGHLKLVPSALFFSSVVRAVNWRQRADQRYIIIPPHIEVIS